jgi:predicted metal-dependent phosphoesterase TrpH
VVQVYFKRTKFIPSVFFKALQNVGLQAVDMHFHTEAGMDSVSSIAGTLKKCRNKGYGVAITDHNDVRGAVKAWRMRDKVFVIPGMEASTESGVHSLYYFSSIRDCRTFFNKVVKPLRKKNPFFLPISLDALMEHARDYNAAIAVSHPYGPGVIGVKKVHFKNVTMKRLKRHFDYVEGLNGANTRHMNERSLAWARFIDKPVVAGSDGHTIAELGSVLTVGYGYDIESFVEGLRHNRGFLLGKETNVFVDALLQFKKEKKYIESAHEMGKGMFWVKEHGREFKTLQEKIKNLGHHFHHSYEMQHGGNKKLIKKHKDYVEIGRNLFR